MSDRYRTRIRAGIVTAVLGTAIGLAAWPATPVHAAACPAVTVYIYFGTFRFGFDAW